MATESRTLIILGLIAKAIVAVIKFIAAAIEAAFDQVEHRIQAVAPDATRIFVELESRP
ncbi:MAG: hypothetical protein HKN01_10100 [Acidimicrobiia bacterium]|nr:hypothetical protein [Acidimicrobiia bacterium]NNF70114.1 hypothetical protein [Acidimicrobiia bacterium]NNK91799.1 hypothetical protein [Acidimicrobiia bacterium]